MSRDFERSWGITGIILGVMIMLAVAMIGCGKEDKNHKTSVAVRSRPERTPVQAAAPRKPAEPVVAAVDETPRVVTYEEAEAAYFDRRYGEAVELFTIYTESRSANPWGFYMLGLSAWKAGDYGKAEESFKTALELDPKHVKSCINLGRVLLDTDRPGEALVKIAEAIVLDPESNPAYRLKGRAFHQMGQKDDAIEAYRRAIKIDGGDAWSMNNLALVLIEEERYEDALGPLARAIEIDGGVAVFHNNLGMALEHSGYIADARSAYGAAVSADEKHGKAYENMVRLEGVLVDPEAGHVDLAALAAGFAGEIESWKFASAGTERADSLMVSETGFMGVTLATEPDSTTTGQE